jgi:TRAP-type C4-dicarboxylate transport system permease large subunit
MIAEGRSKPFLVAMVVLMILLTVWPDLALILPRNMK